MRLTSPWDNVAVPEIADEVDDLKHGMLRYFLAAATVAYFFWHFAMAVIVPPDDNLGYWEVFPIAVLALWGTYLLQRRHPYLASWFCLASGNAAIVAAIWLIPEPSAILLLPVLSLLAVALLRPLAGVLATIAVTATLLLLRWADPLALLSSGLILESGAASLLTVLAAWMLSRTMLLAVQWSLHSYHQAERNAASARQHRAELAVALKQLDLANYRLKRANAALELAWQAADAAERSKTEFVTNISHELRTPLNLIIGFSEMILTAPEAYETPLPAVYRGDLNAIYRSSQHLLTLTNDVIDLARVGIGRLALSREPLALPLVIDDACALVREYVLAKGLHLGVEIQPDLPTVTADHLRVRQVLLNLLTNAARCTQQGGLTVRAKLLESSVLVEVADSGPGIPPAELSGIFAEYRHGGTTPPVAPGQFGGIGLGLPISKRLVELHGGRMGVDSMLGVGATFWFTLPTTASAAEQSSQASGVERPHPPSRTTERVLILDHDDARLSLFLQGHLRNFRIVATPNRQAAIAAAVECRAVAILGDTATAAGPTGELPVPLLRLPLPHAERLADALGVAAYLDKPVTRATLHSAITRLNRPIRSVLVVDDDPRFVRLMTRMLLALPQPPEIFSAHNGREALAILAAAPPDLLLLDLAMPEMGGAELLRQRTAAPGWAGMAVFVISGQDQVVAGLPLTGQVTIDKPDGWRLEELLNATEALFAVLDPPRRYLANVNPSDNTLALDVANR